VKTSAWVGRQMIHMYVRDGNKIIPPSQLTADDYLVLNVSYMGPHLAAAVRDSATLTPLTPVEFAYPLDPQGRPGEAKFSAFGIIGGEMKRAAEQVIPPEDTAVFILATRGGKIELVTSQTILNESDELAQTLKLAQGRPLLSGAVDKSSATMRMRSESKAPAGSTSGKVINGRTVGVEYGSYGASLWIRLPDGSSRQLRLHSVQDSVPFEKDSRLVKVQLDASGEYADSIFLDLVGA
jgi:hypothetical protein